MITFSSCYSFVGIKDWERATQSMRDFLRYMRRKHKKCVQPIVISAHHSTMLISHHQDAARYYLKAYILMQECRLINLCVGNIDAFLYNNLPLADNSQVGFVVIRA